MAFSDLVKNREIAYISKLLTAFGVVEENQIRTLFSHLDAKKYGQIVTRMYREGLVYRTPDAKLIATSRYSIDKCDVKSSVLAFWGFIKIKDRVTDFCPGTAPTLITVSTDKSDTDLIPLSHANIDRINSVCDDLPESTVRLLVTSDVFLLGQLDRRLKNDVAIVVKKDGSAEMYKL